MTRQRLPSGVPGLDTVLNGGFYQSGVYILQGKPGAGKTILANQICFAHAARGGKARVAAPTLVHSASGTTVHWQSGEDAFALTGTAPDAVMQRAASGLNAGRR